MLAWLWQSPNGAASVAGLTPNRIFQHMGEFRIIRCKTWAYAVVPDQMDRHLKDHHKEIAASIRREIVEVVKSMEGVARRKDDIVYPPAMATAIQGFPKNDDGFSVSVGG